MGLSREWVHLAAESIIAKVTRFDRQARYGGHKYCNGERRYGRIERDNRRLWFTARSEIWISCSLLGTHRLPSNLVGAN